MSDLGPLADPSERPPIPARDLRDAIRIAHGKLPFRLGDPAFALNQPHDKPAKRRLTSGYTAQVVLILIAFALNIWLGICAAIAFAIWIACTR